MMNRPRPHKVPRLVSHEVWREDSYLNFIMGQYQHNGHGIAPPITEVRGVIEAEVNHGRWLIVCPAGCGQAVVASMVSPLFICANCGSAENNGMWYHVRFPLEHGLITDMLTKRKIPNQNWKPNDSVAGLLVENREHGIF